MKDIAVQNRQVYHMKEQLFRPLECAPAGAVTVSHSVTLILIAHMMVIIHHNLWLYGFSSLIAEINSSWGIKNIILHAYVSLVPPQYCRQVSPGSDANVSSSQFCCLRF